LVYASLALILFKLFFMALGKTIGRVIFILMLGGFAFVTLMQVNSDGLFATTKKVSVEDDLSSKLKELQSKYDALLLVGVDKNESSAIVKKATELSTTSEKNNSN